jgi:hypothetical protein
MGSLINITDRQRARLVEHFNAKLRMAADQNVIDGQHVVQCLTALDLLREHVTPDTLTEAAVLEAVAVNNTGNRKVRK